MDNDIVLEYIERRIMQLTEVVLHLKDAAEEFGTLDLDADPLTTDVPHLMCWSIHDRARFNTVCAVRMAELGDEILYLGDARRELVYGHLQQPNIKRLLTEIEKQRV